MTFTRPEVALFFHHDSNKLIVACEDGIFIVDAGAQFTQPFSRAPKGAWYYPHALALSNDDAVLVAGSHSLGSFSVCGYSTESLMRLWILYTTDQIGAVGMLGAHVLVTVRCNPTLVLECNTGTHVSSLQKAARYIFGLSVIEGFRFILS